MRVYICGGYNYTETKKIFAQLDSLKEMISEVILGSSNAGCSLVVRIWTDINNIPVIYAKTAAKKGSPEADMEVEEHMRALEPGLVVVFPGGAIIDDFIDKQRKNNRPLLVVEDEEWKLKHSLKTTPEEQQALEEMLAWREDDEELVRCRLVSSFKLTPHWVLKFRELSPASAVYAALKAIRKGNIDAWQELVQIAEDRKHVDRKGCSPLKTVSARENGKKGGRPKKEDKTVSDFIDTVLLEPKTSDWIEPIKEPVPPKSYTKNPGPVRVSKYEF